MKGKCVVFDLDGTLLDTEPLYAEATNRVVREYGKEYTWEVQQHVMGRPELEGAATIVRALDVPLSPEEYLRRRDIYLSELFLSAKPFPGVISLLSRLSRDGYRMAIATSSNLEYLNLKKFHNSDLFNFFNSNVVCGDDPSVINGKPAPDIFIAAARIIDVSPEECCAVEDTAPGVRAAVAAGMLVAGVNASEECRNTLRDAGASCVLSSISDFDPDSLYFNSKENS